MVEKVRGGTRAHSLMRYDALDPDVDRSAAGWMLTYDNVGAEDQCANQCATLPAVCAKWP